VFLSGLLTLLSPATSRAAFIHTFETDRVVFPENLPLSGFFSVEDSAIADGVIETSEIVAFGFTLGVFEFGDDPADLFVATGDFGPGLPVDPLTGLLLPVGQLHMADAAFQTFPIPHESRLVLETGRPPGENFYHDPNDPGFGTWTCRHDDGNCVVGEAVPEPSILGLVLLGGAFLLRRRSSNAASRSV
jgi:hypothetical protein